MFTVPLKYNISDVFIIFVNIIIIVIIIVIDTGCLYNFNRHTVNKSDSANY